MQEDYPPYNRTMVEKKDKTTTMNTMKERQDDYPEPIYRVIFLFVFIPALFTYSLQVHLFLKWIFAEKFFLPSIQ